MSAKPAPAPGPVSAPRRQTTDPYLRWAQLTRFQAFQPNGKWPDFFSFIVERADPVDWEVLRALTFTVPEYSCAIPKVYDDAIGGKVISKFATLRLHLPPTVQLDELEKVLDELVKQPGLLRVQFGHPRGGRGKSATEPHQPMPAGARSNADIVIGVIDDGIPFAHPDLCDDKGRPRMAVLWQQGTRDPVHSRWCRDGRWGYGRMLTHEGMQHFMRQAQREGVLEETLCYQAAFAIVDQAENKLSPPWLKPNRTLLCKASHGGSVLAVAAGKAHALHGTGTPDDIRPQPYGRAGDAASKCPLIAVDLPREQTEISSGRWLPFNGLDALRFVVQQARERFQRPDAIETVPVVINLSSGSSAGAHVGQAMFERAMDELLAADDQLAIVLAAGNSRKAKAHVAFELKPGGHVEIGLYVPNLQPFDTFVEFWMPADCSVEHLSVAVTAPDDQAMCLHAAKAEETMLRGDTVVAALQCVADPVQATDRSMVLLSIAGTVITGRRRNTALPGPWKLSFDLNAAATKEWLIDGWVERDEIVVGQRRDQIARFFPLEGAEPTGTGIAVEQGPVREDNTLSNIATGTFATPVAALRGPALDGVLSSYSGLPKATSPRALAPALMLGALADTGRTHPGVRVNGNRAAVRRRMNGTSVAAPQAARYLANLMATGQGRTKALARPSGTPRQSPQPPPPATPPTGPQPEPPHVRLDDRA